MSLLSRLFNNEKQKEVSAGINNIPKEQISHLLKRAMIQGYMKGNFEFNVYPWFNMDDRVLYFNSSFMLDENTNSSLVVCRSIEDLLVNDKRSTIIIDIDGNTCGKIKDVPLFLDIGFAILDDKHAPQEVKDHIIMQSYKSYTEDREKPSVTEHKTKLDFGKYFTYNSESLHRLFKLLHDRN